MSRKTRSIAAALVFAAAVQAGAAHASPRPAKFTEPAGLFASVWSWLAGQLLPIGGTRLSAVWGQEGGMMDPDGITVDAGPAMDPNGANADEGPMMDPNGFR